MRPVLITTLWAALTVVVWIAAYAWSPLGHMLIPVGAVVLAFVVLFIGDGVQQEIRLTLRMRRYEQQQAFLRHRAWPESEDGE